METKILAEFQICISAPLRLSFMNFDDYSSKWYLLTNIIFKVSVCDTMPFLLILFSFTRFFYDRYVCGSVETKCSVCSVLRDHEKRRVTVSTNYCLTLGSVRSLTTICSLFKYFIVSESHVLCAVFNGSHKSRQLLIPYAYSI